METKSDSRLGTEKILKLMLQLALPSVLAQIVNVLYNIIDRIYIGRIPGVGAAALTGVGVTFPVITIVSAFAGFANGGGAPLAAIAMGQRDNKRAEKILGNSTFLLLVFSGGLMAVFLGLKKPLLYMFGASDYTIEYAASYITVYLLGTVFVELSVGLNTFISCQGYARTAMISVLIGAIVNIILDPVFIFVLDMGVVGAATATVISQALSVVWVLRFLISAKSQIHLRISEARRENPWLNTGIGSISVYYGCYGECDNYCNESWITDVWRRLVCWIYDNFTECSTADFCTNQWIHKWSTADYQL